MYFTQISIRNNELVKMSEYISTRLVRKGDTTSYYVTKCLTCRAEPTIVNSICFLKQTIIREEPEDPLNPNKTESKVERYRRIYNNEVRVHKYVQRQINSSQRYFSKLYDYWHDVDGLNHRFTVVTKYEQFGDLNHYLEYIKDQKIQLLDIDVIFVLNNLLKATLELHKVGVLHRDIKPQNIFIDEFFQIKLGDFGISLLDEVEKKPRSSQKVGTYGFMAPEIFHELDYSFSVDVWAMGCVAYYMMYLVYPYGRERQNYETKVKGRLKDIENASKYNDKFSKRLKEFMRRFFAKPTEQRQLPARLFNYQYMHGFRHIEITASMRKRYEEYISKVNQCNTLEIQRYSLQQHSLYHQKILEAVRYQRWGYFFLLSNLKIIGLFNNQNGKKVIKIFPDCLGDVEDYQKDLHCCIMTFVYRNNFKKFKYYIEKKRIIYTKRLNCTIDNIVQYKNCLAVRLKLDLESKPSRKQLKERQGDELPKFLQEYEQWEPVSSNRHPLNYQNNTFQLFFFPKEGKRQDISYTAYQSSLIFNNNMIKKDQVLVTNIIDEKPETFQMNKYPNPESVLGTGNFDYINMMKHARKLLSIVATKKIEEEAVSAPFLSGYLISEN